MKDKIGKEKVEKEPSSFFHLLKENGVQEIKSLSELKENDLYIIEDDETVVDMILPQVLKDKGLLISDLAKLTGISRQNINAVIRNKMRPGIDFVLKVSFVLGEPIEKLFKLTENAWVKPFKVGRDSTVFLDVLHLRLLDNTQKRKQIQHSKAEYFNKKTKETYSKITYEKMLKEYVNINIDNKEKEILKQEPNLGRNALNSLAIEELKNEFNSDYSKIYKKLGQKFVPYSLDVNKRW
jgi:transcriptional regulator with XRE-family HTH domain